MKLAGGRRKRRWLAFHANFRVDVVRSTAVCQRGQSLFSILLRNSELCGNAAK
jgi:hypothetical protein